MNILEWFNQQSRKDQWAVIVSVFGLCVLIIFWGVWQPLFSARNNLLQSNQAQAAAVQEMKSAAQQVKQLKGSGQIKASTNNVSLSQAVDQASAQFSLKMSRLQPSGDNEAQVWFDGVSYAALIKWVGQMDQHYGIAIRSLSISATDVPGVVNARIRLRKGV